MPTSNLAVAPAVLHLVYLALEDAGFPRPGPPARILDVGPGRGKYGYLIREFVDPDARVDAVEAWEPYITDFGLEHIYETVLAGDVLELPFTVLGSYDVVLMADVIEHIEKAPALELLDRIPGYVVISTPREFFENPAHLPHTEKHVSHWRLEELKANPRFMDYAANEYRNLGGLLVLLGPK